MRIIIDVSGGWALKDTKLVIKPQGGFVRRGHPATLVCEYDLEGAPLYSVKWYRGSREFFRHVPNETPPTKIFPFQGLNLDVSFHLKEGRVSVASPGADQSRRHSPGAFCFLLIAANFNLRRKRFLMRKRERG